MVGSRLAGGLQRVSENNKSSQRKGPPQEDGEQNSYVASVHGLFLCGSQGSTYEKSSVVCLKLDAGRKAKIDSEVIIAEK